jgi:hypothetical protein
LRGILAGSAVTFGLPVLDCWLNSSGTAWADTGAALPPIFGTWFWGLGLAPGFWQPKTTGLNYEFGDQLKVLNPVKAKLNLFSGLQIFLDGKVNQNHYSSPQGIITGTVTAFGPGNGNGSTGFRITLDQLIANHIGRDTRFRSLEAACDGDPKTTWSARGPNGMNPAETSPVALYTRIFGPEFKDPNSAEFTPDPAVMIRRSALSAITDQRQELLKRVGSADRVRLDEYFSSVRDLEQQLDIQLKKPAPLPACTMPTAPEKDAKGTLLEDGMMNHRLFSQLLTHAVACGQTRVFNLLLSQGMSGFRMNGETTGHHTYTHEEPIDQKAGYQIKASMFTDRYMKGLLELVQTLDSVREGSRTLLDRTALFCFTDHSEARIHSMVHFPILVFGSAGGRFKTGYHVQVDGDSCTRVGLTVQQALGLPVSSWGTESNEAKRPFTEVIA